MFVIVVVGYCVRSFDVGGFRADVSVDLFLTLKRFVVVVVVVFFFFHLVYYFSIENWC